MYFEEKIPYIVAINKIDKPGADVERTKASLAENEIYVEGYGGDVPVVPISALQRHRSSELLDMVMLVADLQDLKANVNVPAEGAIIEAGLDNKKGIYATLLIKNGTLSSGMYVVAEDAIAPVRILEDYPGQSHQNRNIFEPCPHQLALIKFQMSAHNFNSRRQKEAEELAASFKPALQKSLQIQKRQMELRHFCSSHY
jgi:translation initiation factor IF-2